MNRRTIISKNMSKRRNLLYSHLLFNDAFRVETLQPRMVRLCIKDDDFVRDLEGSGRSSVEVHLPEQTEKS
jgi:hypothetical protein